MQICVHGESADSFEIRIGRPSNYTIDLIIDIARLHTKSVQISPWRNITDHEYADEVVLFAGSYICSHIYANNNTNKLSTIAARMSSELMLIKRKSFRLADVL